MKTPNTKADSQKLAGMVRMARLQVATAETRWEAAKAQARLAKRRRKEARQAARRARKLAKQAKKEFAEAKLALAEAEAAPTRAGKRTVRRKARREPAVKKIAVPHARKKVPAAQQPAPAVAKVRPRRKRSPARVVVAPGLDAQDAATTFTGSTNPDAAAEIVSRPVESHSQPE